MQKVLVIGGNSFLGRRIIKLYGKNFQMAATFNAHRPPSAECAFFRLDVRDRDGTLNLIRSHRPDVVVHIAALTDVDFCEDHHEEAWKINVDGTRNVLDGCVSTGAKMILLSTDYVFDGEAGSYGEEDRTSPVSFYGRTKLEGENLVRSSNVDWTIVRTSVLYGLHGRRWRMNFATWVMDMLSKKKQISVVTDQFNTPTLVEDCAGAIVGLMKDGRRGVYHVVGRECINRYQFSLKIAHRFGLAESCITPITSEVLAQAAPRPRNSCLRVDKLERELKVRMFTVDEGLDLMAKQSSAEPDAYDII